MHKICFEIGGLTVTWFGVFVASGFLAGLWTASRRALRENISPDTIFDLGPWLLFGTIIGARLWYVVSYWKESFANSPWYEVFMVQHGGIVFYGGLIGASLACMIFVWRKRLPLWKLSDILAPSIALGSFFGRWGCLMNGCCYGRPTTMPWGIHFPYGHETYPNAVHPTEIYDSLLNLCLYAALAWVFRRKKFDGQVFAIFLIGYAAIRSFVEIFRGDYTPEHYLGPLSPGQLMSIGVVIIGVVLLFILPRKKDEQATPVNTPMAGEA